MPMESCKCGLAEDFSDGRKRRKLLLPEDSKIARVIICETCTLMTDYMYVSIKVASKRVKYSSSTRGCDFCRLLMDYAPPKKSNNTYHVKHFPHLKMKAGLWRLNRKVERKNIYHIKPDAEFMCGRIFSHNLAISPFRSESAEKRLSIIIAL